MKSIGIVIALLAAIAAEANDRHGVPRSGHWHASSQQHDGLSPFPPPPDDDTLFIVDSGGDLDTDCTYHSGGPLIIHLPVTRYVGPVLGDGTLVDPSKLVNAGYVSNIAHLRLPAFDVDIFGDPTDPAMPPEVDRVTFNGHFIGTLTGDNDIWKLNEFEIRIEWVKFPAMGSDGVAPAPSDNQIRIDIDTGSGGEDNWCTSVDWAEIDFGAIAPIFLVHGILSSGFKAWPDFHAAFANAGIPFSDDIDLSKVGSIEGNVATLAGRLRALATKFGAKKCHIVAHSKGGLDIRAYLNCAYQPNELRVLSLYTLSTPHRGTVVADMGVAVEDQLPQTSLTRLILAQFLPFIADLSTSSMAVFNARYPSVPEGIHVYSYGADADADHNLLIDENESAGLFGASLSTFLYQTIGTEATMTVTTPLPAHWGDVSVPVIEVQPTSAFAKNDVLVSTASAAAPFGAYLGDRTANHANMKSGALAGIILQQIVGDYPNR